MTGAWPIIFVGWCALSGVWMVLLWVQRQASRHGLLLEAAVGGGGESRSWPAVAVIIPARNEAATIASCLDHVLAQDYPKLSITVVDDRSEDNTADIVAALGRRHPQVRLCCLDSLPPGWLAKSHALWRGSHDLHDEWLLFIDADTSLHPACVRTAVIEAERRRADLFTLYPRNAAVGFWEHLVIPLCGAIIMLWFGTERRPFANGQFLLIRREVYERTGGHAAVRDALIEDIPLAEKCAATGAKVVAAGGAELVGVRMYDSARGVRDGWTRIFAGALRSPLKLIVSVLWLVFGSLLPHVAMPILLWNLVYHPTTSGLLLLALCAQHLALIYMVSYRFWRMGRCDLRYLWLYPLSVIIVSAILLRATWVLMIGRAVTWRGVRYRIDGRARLTTHGPARARPAWVPWAAWLVLAAVSAGGLRNYRIENSLDAWLPELRAVGPHGPYAVLGWPTSRASRDEVAARVASVRGLAGTIDRPGMKRFGSAFGVTPDGFVVSADGSYEGMFLFRDGSVSDTQFVVALREALSGCGDVALGGPAVYAVTLDEVSQHRMPLVMTAIVAVGLILLWLVTGSIAAAAAGIAAIALSQVILLGGLAWFGFALDMSLMMVPPLMMSLGMSYAAHRAVGRGDVGVLALCALTSALGIACFVTTPLPPIRSFAVAGAMGLALTWLAVITLVPRVRAAGPGLRVPGRRIAMRFHQARGAGVLAAAVLIFAMIPILAPRLRFAADPVSYFPQTHRTTRDFETLDRRLTGMLPFQVVSSDPEVRGLLERTRGVRKVIKIPMPLVSGVGAYWCLADNAALPHLSAAQPSWTNWAASRRARLDWRGVAAQPHVAEQVLGRVALGSLTSMAAVAAGAVFLRTRRPALAAFAGLLVLLPVAALVELATLLEIPITLASLMIGSISIGMAVDDMLHITCATRASGSVARGIGLCWRGCVGSSLINIVCLSCFALSPFRPTQQFGVLLAGAAALSMLSNQLVWPALLALDLRWARQG